MLPTPALNGISLKKFIFLACPASLQQVQFSLSKAGVGSLFLLAGRTVQQKVLRGPQLFNKSVLFNKKKYFKQQKCNEISNIEARGLLISKLRA